MLVSVVHRRSDAETGFTIEVRKYMECRKNMKKGNWKGPKNLEGNTKISSQFLLQSRTRKLLP